MKYKGLFKDGNREGHWEFWNNATLIGWGNYKNGKKEGYVVTYHKNGKFKSNNKITHHYPYCDPLVAIMLSNFGQISWIDKRLIHLNTDLNSVTSKTDDYGAYTSAENYVLDKLNKSTKKIKNTHTYFVIYSNISDWFIHNRLTTIKKRDFLLNVKYILVYFFDLFKLTVNKKGVFKISFIILNLLRIIKSMN